MSGTDRKRSAWDKRSLTFAARNDMITLVLAASFFAADVNESPLDLLGRFRQEFVSITPGRDGFASGLLMGYVQVDASEQSEHRVTLITISASPLTRCHKTCGKR